MAILDKIVVQDFRNISLAELRFSPKVNCISGNNGEGKTNLMDAIWYLSMTKSAFSSSDRFNFRHGTDTFSIAGTYLMDNGTCSKFAVSVSDGGEKKLRRDDKPYGKISEHIGVLPIVMVSPSDTALVSESGEERRKFLNAVLSQMDRKYLSDVQQYNRLLLQRNRELKNHRPDVELLGIFDARMSAYASSVHEARKRFIDDLNPVVSRYYELISGGKEEVSIGYSSDLEKGDLESLLAESREKDLAMRFTTAGIQRDDLAFMMGGHPIRKCGSQGQQKSFLVALKFAEYDIMKRTCGFAPIMLLDDLFDKLDLGRVHNLLDMVAGHDFGQIFLSDSNKTRISTIVDDITSDRAYFEAAGGVFTRKDE